MEKTALRILLCQVLSCLLIAACLVLAIRTS